MGMDGIVFDIGEGADGGSAGSGLPQRGQKRASALAVAPQARQTVDGVSAGGGVESAGGGKG